MIPSLTDLDILELQQHKFYYLCPFQANLLQTNNSNCNNAQFNGFKF